MSEKTPESLETSHHPCPRCGGVNVPLEIEEESSKKEERDHISPTGYGTSTILLQNSQTFYRIHCKDCRLSTKQNVRIIDTINEWNTFKKEYSK